MLSLYFKIVDTLDIKKEKNVIKTYWSQISILCLLKILT
jgi:hypothetical protein